MINWLRRLFTPKRPFICGGEGYIEVVDALGRPVAGMWYRRPTSDEKLDYVYQQQHALANSEERLREVQEAGDKAKKCHEIIWRDLCLPFAETVFLRSWGYVDGKGGKLAPLGKDEQFVHLKEHQAHHLVDMVGIAFSAAGVVKKKS